MKQFIMEKAEKRVTEQRSSGIPKKNSQNLQSEHALSNSTDNRDLQNGGEVVPDMKMSAALQERLGHTTDSDSQDSSSHAFAEPPSFDDVADDLSEAELSDLELNFDGPIEWPGEPLSEDSSLELKLPRKIHNSAPLLENAAAKLLLYQEENPDFKTVDPQTQARLEALLEAAGIGKLSTTDGKAFADPEVLRKLTSSVSCALDEAAAALTRMRAETHPSIQHNDRTLAEACSDGDIEAVKRLLSEGRSVHETTEEGESLLGLACSAGYYELAEVLLRMRANVEDRGIKGDCTPLMEAASGGFVDIVRLLIAYDADVNAQSSAGHTALHHAAVGGYEEVVQILIEAGANVEEQNENGHTPLMEAASAGHVGVAQILLDAGAGINTHSNEFKESALTLACYKGHLPMVKFLLDAGADQEHKTDEMHTALMEASMDGHVEVARLLLDSGAQVNMPADSFESPLTLAACGGHVDLANLLIERGANLEEVNDEGYTPLMEAAREGHEEMVALLLAHGAEVNAQTEETQETALTLACCGGFIEVAHFLIRANANIELGCSTPLMEAAQEGHLDLVKYLIKQGSNVHAVTGTGDSALTYACENGHTDVADVVLQAGAKLEHESEGGRTPLMKAARAGHLCTVQFLLSKGANVNRATTNNDHTVLSLACAGGHLSVVELLLEHGADPLHKLKDGSTMLIEAAKGGHTTVVNLLLDYPQTLHKTIPVSSEYPDGIPMADDLPPDLGQSKDLGLRTTESLASRLEQFIHKMMSQAENSSGTREEQMARKQEILEELQRVEQELKFRTQMAQLESQPTPPTSLDSQDGDTPAPPPPTSLSSSPPNFLPSHELVKQELQQKQMEIKEHQKHEQQLQQQKEFYQAKLQNLKQQYHQKQQQLQQQRQRLISETANNVMASSDSEEPAKRQPIPLHIALQNHLHAHHVTEGNVNDLAQALQDWDTRDRNISLPSTHVKPMPAFNLSCKHEEEFEPPTLPLEDYQYSETPASRSLADSLAALIHSKDNKADFDPSLEQVIQSTSNLKRPHNEYEAKMKVKTLDWLKEMDERCEEQRPERNRTQLAGPPMLTAPKPIAKKTNEIAEKSVATAARITRVPNGFVEPKKDRFEALMPGAVLPNPPRSMSPARVPRVDPNAETDSNHDTALTLACAGGHAELVKLLLNRNAEIEHRDKKGFTPLILAATAGHAEVVEILIEQGADIEAQSERTKDTPLSLACSGGRYEVVEILLRLGANKEHRNVSDYTPLSLAASGGYVNIIKLLLSYGAEINSRTGSKLGISPLMLAAMNGHTAAVKLLLDMGSDINAQIETNRNTALTLACFQGRHDVVSLLVDRKANIEHRAKTGLTPLMEAASGGYVDVGRVLLDKGADVNAPPVPSSKDTALTIAADKGHYRFVELLLSRGAAVDVKNKKGNSPLWLACNGGHLDVVQLLVQNGADIDSQDNRRVSSLMTAFRRGHVKVVKWLVRHVTQFPSDKECARYITTVNDKELLKKCQSCMEIIVQAKEAQAKEAQKNAEFLLEQIESEKSREEKKKEAAARRREKKKQKRKEKQAEQQTDKQSPELQRKGSPTAADSPDERAESPISEQDDVIEEEEMDIRTSIVSNNQKSNTSQAGANKRQNKSNRASSKEKQTRGKSENREENRQVDQDRNSVKPQSNNRNTKEAKPSTGVQRTNSNKQQTTDSSKNESNKAPNRKETAPLHKTSITSSTKITELDDFGETPVIANGKPHNTRPANNKRDRNLSNMNQLDSFEPLHNVKYGSPNKHGSLKTGVSPSPGKKKREEGWKEVVRKSKKVVVPANVVSRLSKQLHGLKEMSGAHIEIEKADKKSTERTVTIRGSTEATRQAGNLIAAWLRELEKELSDVTKNKKQSATSSSTQNTSTSQSAAQDTMSSIGTFSIADFIVTSQVVNVTETKPKQVQSKTGWPVVSRAPAATQSAWSSGNSAATVLGSSSQTLVSPIPPKPASNGPVRATNSPAPPKQPSDVSRQLFPESKPSQMPPRTPNERPPTQMNRSPVVGAFPPTQRSPPLAPVSSAVSVPGGGGTIPQGMPHMVPGFAMRHNAPRPSGPPAMIQRPPASYSPFDQLPLLNSYEFTAAELNQQERSKAPGYRPERPSPYMAQFSPSHMAGMEDALFSKAPGSRPSSSADHLLSPLNSRSVSSNVQNLFTNSNSSSHNMPIGTMGDSVPTEAERDRYTTADQPMTLPRISSSLNPNACEFTAVSRYSSDGASQQSPRPIGTKPQMSPPMDLRPSPPVSAFQPQCRTPVSSQPKSDQEIFMRQKLPLSSSPAGQMNLVSQYNQVPLLQPNLPMPQYSQHSYSPTARPLMMPITSEQLMYKADDSPPNLGQGDTLQSRSMRPIGGERHLNIDPVIWATTKQSDATWAVANTEHLVNDSGYVYKVPGVMSGLPAMSTAYPFYPGAAGDSMHTLWHNSPSKTGPSHEWNWDQHNTPH